MGGMGIRYYACTWAADDIDLVLEEPRLALPRDPFMEVWSLRADDRSRLLYLDKLWPEFQHLTTADGQRGARPCHRMFEGHVTHVELGWHPWIRAITPRETRAVARDLDLVTDDDITRRFGTDDVLDTRLDVRRADLAHYLDTAKAFTRRAVRNGEGIVYMIG
jgi:hypothetical protein